MVGQGKCWIKVQSNIVIVMASAMDGEDVFDIDFKNRESETNLKDRTDDKSSVRK